MDRQQSVMPHARHKVLQCRATVGSELIAGMPQIVEMQACRANRPHRVRPAGHLVEVSPPERATLDPGEPSEPGSAPVKAARCSRSAGMIASGMPTTRRPARDLGGPSSISPVKRGAWRRREPGVSARPPALGGPGLAHAGPQPLIPLIYRAHRLRRSVRHAAVFPAPGRRVQAARRASLGDGFRQHGLAPVRKGPVPIGASGQG
jgi:hypothetical protein